MRQALAEVMSAWHSLAETLTEVGVDKAVSLATDRTVQALDLARAVGLTGATVP